MGSNSEPRAPGWRFWLGASLSGAVLAAWVVWFSPWLYPQPEPEPLDKTIQHRVFAYGTLTNIVVRSAVARSWLPGETATLPGYMRQQLDVVAEPDEQVNGVVFDVTPRQLRRLDRYERLGARYHRELKILADGEPAWVYQLIAVMDAEPEPDSPVY